MNPTGLVRWERHGGSFAPVPGSINGSERSIAGLAHLLHNSQNTYILEAESVRREARLPPALRERFVADK